MKKIALFSIAAALALAAVIAYGYLIPGKYYFECEGTENVTTYNLKSGEKVSSIWEYTTESVLVKEYFFGLRHSLDYYSLVDCGNSLDAIVCSRDSKDDYISFDLIRSVLSKSQILINAKKEQKRQIDSSNLKCEKKKTALEK